MIALFAEAPALPLHTAGPYVAAAYIVFVLIILVYVWIMARKLTRNSRELRDLRAQIEERDRGQVDAATEDAKESEPVS
jgi:HAMP domain-containing protein